MKVHVETNDVDGVTILVLRGRITLGEGSSLLREALRHALNHSNRVLIDLAEVTYIDSTGLGELVGGFVSAQNRGAEVKLLHIKSQIKDLLQVTKLLTVFECFEDQGIAIASFSKAAASEA
jgi:anti-sigma B factor antagonist